MEEAIPTTGLRVTVMKSLCVAIAARLLPADKRRKLRIKGVKVFPQVVDVGGFHVDAVVILRKDGVDPSRIAERLCAAVGLNDEELLGHSCTLAGVPTPFFFPKAASVHVHDEDPNKDDEKLLRKEAVEAYTILLEELSRLSGTEVHFHHGGGFIKDPFPEDGKSLHVYSNGGPPGDFVLEYQAVAFGMSVNQDNLAVLRRTATKGRGSVVKDKELPVAQVLGPNLYFLLPMVSSYHRSASPVIFLRLMIMAWNQRHRDLKEGAGSLEPAKREEFIEASKEWITAMDEVHRKALRDNDGKIQELQKKLADLLRYRRELEAILSSFGSSPFVTEAIARAETDFDAIRRLPEVRRVAVVDKGVHVETKVVHAEHGGKRYALGRYAIRVSSTGGVSVWCEETLHPKRIPHPHIHLDGNACFGNAVEAIAKNAAYHRYLDTVTLVLRWLMKGYTPVLANAKIDEWPEAPAETAKAAPAVEPQAHDPDKAPDTQPSVRHPEQELAAASRRPVDVTVVGETTERTEEGGTQ